MNNLIWDRASRLLIIFSLYLFFRIFLIRKINLILSRVILIIMDFICKYLKINKLMKEFFILFAYLQNLIKWKNIKFIIRIIIIKLFCRKLKIYTLKKKSFSKFIAIIEKKILKIKLINKNWTTKELLEI